MIRAIDQTYVIHLRGMHERGGGDGGPSITFLAALDRDRILPMLMSYPHHYGKRASWAESASFARESAVEQIRMTRRPVVLSGYSAGARIAGSLAADIGAGRIEGIDADKVLACVLMGDPCRPEHAGTPGLSTPPGWGIAGQRDVPGVVAYWATAHQDPIAALPADSPLRGLVDLEMMFGHDPRGWAGWANDLMQTLICKSVEPWWRHPFRPRIDWGESIAALNGYALHGWHTDDYVRDGICTALADVINKVVPG